MEYFEIKTLKAMVESVLRDIPDTRNSDIKLTVEIWKRFYPKHVENYLGKNVVSLEALYELPREDNVKRVRAHFQNVKKLYLPTEWAIAKKRGLIENEWRVAMGYPTKETTGTGQPSYVPESEKKVDKF